jgi:hypothetical protein
MKKVNYVALAAASVVTYLLGFVWFILLFSEPFVKGLGKTAEEMARGPDAVQASIMQVIGNFITLYILLWLMNKLKITTVMDAIKFAGIIWLGFVGAVLAPMYAFEAYSLSFFAITSGSVLVTLVVGAAILRFWK